MNNTFQKTYPDTVLSCLATYDKQGPEKFYELFGINWDNSKGYEPLFLALNYSSMGGLAETYGLLTKNGKLYEVYGTECSMYAFLEQWKPEKTTYASILHRINVGELGMDKGYNESSFAYALKETVVGLMEKENLVSYNNCNELDKYHLYAKSFNEQALKINNVLAYKMLEDITHREAYQSYFNPSYFERLKNLFEPINTDDYEDVYCFNQDNVCVFYKLSKTGSLEISFSHKDIYNKEFSLFNYSADINAVTENIVLSLLENNNLFESNQIEQASQKKFKQH
jgi:hypothetical protein